MVAQNHSSNPNLAVSVRGLEKGFGSGLTRVEVLHGIELDALNGEILILAGPSGCGKTTLLTLIGGLLHPDGGEIRVLGHSLEQMSEADKTAFRRRHIGFIFQQYNLLPTLTAAENAAVPLLIRGIPRHKALKESGDFLGRVGLSHRVGALPSKLSGGEQQRVAIARALIADPQLLICDEPTASLDGETGNKVMETLRATAMDKNRCVIVVTHDSRNFPFGDRIARMLDGRIGSVEKMPAGSGIKEH